MEICILAGGLGTRMGRDKSRVRLAGRTMLARVRRVAQMLPGSKPAPGSRRAGRAGERRPVSVRVIRRDCVPRCGPLGGILTALKTSSAGAVLFLACDMPLVSARLLRRLMERSRGGRPVFATQNGRAGFPFIIPVAMMTRVERQIARGQFSIQRLAAALEAGRLRIPLRSRELFNVNTRRDLAVAARLLRKRE